MYREPFSGLRWGFPQEGAWRPPTDVYETDDHTVVIVEIAGLQEGDYEVSLSGRALVITGERRDPAEKLTYQQMEIRYGKFRSQVYLPWPVDTAGIEVGYANGLLRISLNKARARRIPIQVGGQSES